MKLMRNAIILSISAVFCASCSSYYANHSRRVKPMPIAAKEPPANYAERSQAGNRSQTQTQGAQFGNDVAEYDDGSDIDSPYNTQDNNSPNSKAQMAAQNNSMSPINPDDSVMKTHYRKWAAQTQNPKCLITNGTAGTEQHYFFGLNKSLVEKEFVRSVDNQAQFLLTHPNVKVRIEGNADERGSREYNIALAARRAKAVVAMFKQRGVPTSQYSMVSYGAEKPAAKGENEDAYHCNRRVDIIYEVDTNA